MRPAARRQTRVQGVREDPLSRLRIIALGGADAEVFESGTSMRIILSCLEVSRSSPSPVRLMCRSARGILVPMVRSISSCIDTLTRLLLLSRT
jgi:hypothetical protein